MFHTINKGFFSSSTPKSALHSDGKNGIGRITSAISFLFPFLIGLPSSTTARQPSAGFWTGLSCLAEPSPPPLSYPLSPFLFPRSTARHGDLGFHTYAPSPAWGWGGGRGGGVIYRNWNWVMRWRFMFMGFKFMDLTIKYVSLR